MRSIRVILLILLLSVATAPLLRAQGGPPPKVKEKIAHNNNGINPFLTEDEMSARLEKEMGVSLDVYNEVKKTLTMTPEQGEVGHDVTEKPATEIMLSLIIATARVNAGEKTGKFMAANRKADLLNEANRIITRRRAHDGWGGIAEESGFNSPGDLFAAQRAIEFGMPFTAETQKRLGYGPSLPQTQTQ